MNEEITVPLEYYIYRSKRNQERKMSSQCTAGFSRWLFNTISLNKIGGVSAGESKDDVEMTKKNEKGGEVH